MTRTVEDLGSEIERRWMQLGTAPTDDEMKMVDLPQQVPAGRLLLGRRQGRLPAARSFRP